MSSSPSSPASSSASAPQESDRERVGRMLSRIAPALFVVFIAVVVATVLPPRLFDPAWQLRWSATLINNGTIALLGLVLIWLAPLFHPSSGRIRARRDFVASWALAAVIGYPLLIPLQGYALWRGIGAADGVRSQQLNIARERVQKLRTAVREATSTAQLQARLQALQGPSLPPADLSRPIESLRPQILAGLDTAEAGVRQRLGRLPPDRLWQLIQESLRVIISALAYAFAFAAGTSLRDQPFSLLDTVQKRMERSRRQAEVRRMNASHRRERER
ncbi:MAG: hypothetical protein ACKO25_08545 [Cyanobium sp.]